MSETSSSSKNKNIKKSENKAMKDRLKHLQNWGMPKIPISKIYYVQGWFRMFGSSSDHAIQTIEREIPLRRTLETVRLFEGQGIERQRRMYKFLHIGLVQVAIQPLVELRPDKSILLCLRDKRLLNFEHSLLGGVESSLDDGPLHFNCYPNYSIYLRDPHILDTLFLNIKTNGFDMVETCTQMVLIYRVYYKLLNNVFNTKAYGRSYIIQSDIPGANVIVPKNLHFLQCSKVGNKNNCKIVHTADGSVELTFSSLEKKDSESREITTRSYKINEETTGERAEWKP